MTRKTVARAEHARPPMPVRNLAPAQSLPWRSWYSLQRWRTRAKHSSRSSPYAVYAGNEASSRAQRSPIITRLTKATTTPSCSVQSARFASNAIKANGPSTLEAIAQPLEMTAYR